MPTSRIPSRTSSPELWSAPRSVNSGDLPVHVHAGREPLVVDGEPLKERGCEPNLRGACPVGHDDEDRSYVAQTVGRNGLDRRRGMERGWDWCETGRDDQFPRGKRMRARTVGTGVDQACWSVCNPGTSPDACTECRCNKACDPVEPQGMLAPPLGETGKVDAGVGGGEGGQPCCQRGRCDRKARSEATQRAGRGPPEVTNAPSFHNVMNSRLAD